MLATDSRYEEIARRECPDLELVTERFIGPALASLATEQIRGKTVEQALAMSGAAFAGELGPLPPLKIHCAQLVESAVHDVLSSEPSGAEPRAATIPVTAPAGENLRERFLRSGAGGRGQKLVRLPRDQVGD